MDARERFQKIVVPSYNRFTASPNDFSLLDNLICSINPIAEYLGLQQLDYPPHVSRNERRRAAQEIRRQSDLMDLQKCAEVIKHVRIELTQDGVTSTLSSTGIDTANPATWKVGELDLVQWLMMDLRRSTAYSHPAPSPLHCPQDRG